MSDQGVVRLLSARTDRPLPRALRDRIEALLPEDERARIERYRLLPDRRARWWGMALVDHGLSQAGEERALSRWRRDRFNRPTVDGRVDFNLSHAGEYVVAAFRVGARVGVDIERVAPLPLDDFRAQFTEGEWRRIVASPDPLREFYRGWTAKEAAVKGDGRGLSLPLTQVTLAEGEARIEGGIWRIARIAIDSGYEACVAVDAEGVVIETSLPAELG